MADGNADSLRVDCLLEKPKDFNWSEGYGIVWDVVQPFFEEDFNEDDDPDAWRENEEKTGFSSFDSMLDDNQPMMNYYYPLYHGDSFDSEAAKKLRHLNLCLIQFYETETQSEGFALALTGGGMDLSWDIVTGYIRLGYYPPVHFRLPNFAGMRKSAGREAVIDACVKGREIVKTWMDNDIRDLERVRASLSPLDPKGDKNER